MIRKVTQWLRRRWIVAALVAALAGGLTLAPLIVRAATPAPSAGNQTAPGRLRMGQGMMGQNWMGRGAMGQGQGWMGRGAMARGMNRRGPAGFGAGRMGRGSFGPMGQLLPLTGTISDVTSSQLDLNLSLPNRKVGARAMRPAMSKDVTLGLDDTTLVFNSDLSKAAAVDLSTGMTVTVVPRMEWGSSVAQLVFAGSPKELAQHFYRGRLTSVDGDTLQLQAMRQQAITVTVSSDTVWYDAGRMGRPDNLPVGLALQVLGTENADGQVQAVLITPVGWMR